jgi:hypothetical protein
MAMPEKANFIPNIPKVTPKFFRHYQLSIDSGGLPFTGRKSSNYYGWMRFKKPPQSINEAHIDFSVPIGTMPLSYLYQLV